MVSNPGEARFEFGANWRRFLATVDEERIAEAMESLRSMLAVEHLEGRRFLDIGCGSGLFSLAARRLGADVRSFDFDAESVACTRELKRRYRAEDDGWTIEAGLGARRVVRSVPGKVRCRLLLGRSAPHRGPGRCDGGTQSSP